MTKAIFMLMLCSLAVLLAGCNHKNDEYKIQADYSIESYDQEQTLCPDETQTETFAVSDKKYRYNESDLTILNILPIQQVMDRQFEKQMTLAMMESKKQEIQEKLRK